MRASHEVERIKLQLSKAWDIEYQEWIGKLMLNRTLNDLVSRKGTFRVKGRCVVVQSICNLTIMHPSINGFQIKLLNFMKQVLLKNIFLKTMPRYKLQFNSPTSGSTNPSFRLRVCTTNVCFLNQGCAKCCEHS